MAQEGLKAMKSLSRFIRIENNWNKSEYPTILIAKFECLLDHQTNQSHDLTDPDQSNKINWLVRIESGW